MKPALLLYPHISSYPVLLLLGFFFGWLLARSRARFYGIAARDLDNICLLLPLAGLFGARFFARLFYAKLPLFEALKVWEGDGLVFYGGFLFGVGAVLLYGFVRRMRLSNLVDCVAPSVALGLACGRIGCFLAGCCWGDACVDRAQLAAIQDAQVRQRIQTIPAISQPAWPFAVRFPQRSDAYKQHEKLGLLEAANSRSLPVHPVQLYEALLSAGLCVFLCIRSKYARHRGDVALEMLVGYAVIRFATEYLHCPAPAAIALCE
jgi:phosphatidylglycerol---prolipoprotein diacylglyceryl transferase